MEEQTSTAAMLTESESGVNTCSLAGSEYRGYTENTRTGRARGTLVLLGCSCRRGVRPSWSRSDDVIPPIHFDGPDSQTHPNKSLE